MCQDNAFRTQHLESPSQHSMPRVLFTPTPTPTPPVAAMGSGRVHGDSLSTSQSLFHMFAQGAVAVGLHLRLGDSALSNASKKKNVRYPPECVLPNPDPDPDPNP